MWVQLNLFFSLLHTHFWSLRANSRQCVCNENTRSGVDGGGPNVDVGPPTPAPVPVPVPNVPSTVQAGDCDEIVRVHGAPHCRGASDCPGAGTCCVTSFCMCYPSSAFGQDRCVPDAS